MGQMPRSTERISSLHNFISFR